MDANGTSLSLFSLVLSIPQTTSIALIPFTVGIPYQRGFQLHIFLTTPHSMYAWVFSPVRLFVTPWTVAHQAPLSMGFSRKQYWSGVPFLPPGDLPDPGVYPLSPEIPALAGRFLTTASPAKSHKGPLSCPSHHCWSGISFIKSSLVPLLSCLQTLHVSLLWYSSHSMVIASFLF